MKRILAALVALPLVSAGIGVYQTLGVTSVSQAPFAVLSGGDQGTATIGASGTSATVSVADSAILTPDDVLDITTSSAGWSVRAQYVSHTGFTGVATSFTLTLQDGLLAPQQIRIANGAVTQTTGTLADLPTAQDTQLFATASLLAAGTVTLHLVIEPDSGTGPVFRYAVVVTVT